MNRVLVCLACLSLLAAAGCGSSGPTCGPGTVEQDGRCVPEIGECGPGTVLQDGQCLPECGADEYWDPDDGGCRDIPDCAPGTRFDSELGDCVPACDDGQFWDPDTAACLDVPDCAPGTRFDADSGACVPDASACAAGSHMEDGVCVPDLRCGPGTEPVGGVCLPAGPAVPDVPESDDPDQPAAFDLPADGESVSLGGLLDTPADTNGDGYPEGDWDAFAFHAEAGSYLRIQISSSGAALPAFMVFHEDPLDPSLLDFVRYAIEPNSAMAAREVYLPMAGEYTLLVTDYHHMVSHLFGIDTLPVGGPDFDYFAVIENLGQPVIEDDLVLPGVLRGDHADGALHFYRLPALSDGAIVALASLGLPEPDEDSDLFPVVSLLDADTWQVLREDMAFDTWADAEFSFAAEGDRSYLAVQDFLAGIGPRRTFALRAAPLQPLDCDGGACALGGVAQGEQAMLRWDLDAGDFLALSFFLTPETMAAVNLSLLDADMQPVVPEQYVYPGINGWGRTFAAETGPVYLWLRWSDGWTDVDFEIEELVLATPQLGTGHAYTDLAVPSMPFRSVPDAEFEYFLSACALEHFQAPGGYLVFFSGFTPRDGAWSEQYSEWIATVDFELAGPAVDLDSWNFPDGFISPSFAYARDTTTLLHWVYDLYGDVADGSYDVNLVAMEAGDLGAPAVGAPVEADTQLLDDGMRIYRFTGERSRHVEITVEPAVTSFNLQPDVWVFDFGRPLWSWIWWIWEDDPDSPRLGLVAREIASAPGEAVTVGYTSPYDGLSLILLQDAGTASPLAFYSVSIDVPAPPGNDGCEDATAISPDGSGHASVQGSTSYATDSLTESACFGYQTSGADVFYRLDLQAGQRVEIALQADFAGAVLALFADCAEMSCLAAADEGEPLLLGYTAEQAGMVYLAVDAYRARGDFSLDLTVTGE
ncbi:MAG: hypothetical protein JXR96_03230 [Deltaproteobacteria bacterium]|nr:hypothetical protein [Deltaproteobacteria bacterium]